MTKPIIQNCLKLILQITAFFSVVNIQAQTIPFYEFPVANEQKEWYDENYIFNITRKGNSTLILPRSNNEGYIQEVSANGNIIFEMEMDMLNMIDSKSNLILKPYFLFGLYWNSEKRIISNTGKYVYCDNSQLYNKDSNWNRDVLYDLNENRNHLLIDLPNSDNVIFSEDDKYAGCIYSDQLIVFNLDSQIMLSPISFPYLDNRIEDPSLIGIRSQEKKIWVLLHEFNDENGKDYYKLLTYNFEGVITDSLKIEIDKISVYYTDDKILLCGTSNKSTEISYLRYYNKHQGKFISFSNKNIQLINKLLKKNSAKQIEVVSMSANNKYLSLKLYNSKQNKPTIEIIDLTKNEVLFSGLPITYRGEIFHIKQENDYCMAYFESTHKVYKFENRNKNWINSTKNTVRNFNNFNFIAPGNFVLSPELIENDVDSVLFFFHADLSTGTSKVHFSDSLYGIYFSQEANLWNEMDPLYPWSEKRGGMGNNVIIVDENKNFGIDGTKEDRAIFYNSKMDTELKKYVYFNLYNDFKHIFYTPDHYYFTNETGKFSSYFNYNLKTFPLQQFDLKYNRPDIILERLGYSDTMTIAAYKKAYLKRLKRLGFTEEMLKDDFHLPTIRIENIETLPVETDSSSINLNLDINDSQYLLDRINVYINDVPVYGSNGISLRDPSTKKVLKKINIELSSGENKIQVSVLNQVGAESFKETVFIKKTKSKKNKPDLYLITIGDSKYSDARYDLTYASKDATDIKNAFEKNDNSIYETVHSFSYTDNQVTKENILKLKSELLKAKRDDVVIITVAGHGVLDNDFNYYLATYDMDFSNPKEKGLPYEELESLLDGIAPLKKVLFLDACHSGEVDKEEVEQIALNTKSNGSVKFREAGAGIQKKNMGLKSTSELMGELFTDLRKGTGATVISSAGGVELAMESDQWKNGLFTYCLLHGIQDKAADINKDGKIMLSELQNYLRKEVTSLSNGSQQPTSRIENLSMDFRVW